MNRSLAQRIGQLDFCLTRLTPDGGGLPVLCLVDPKHLPLPGSGGRTSLLLAAVLEAGFAIIASPDQSAQHAHLPRVDHWTVEADGDGVKVNIPGRVWVGRDPVFPIDPDWLDTARRHGKVVVIACHADLTSRDFEANMRTAGRAGMLAAAVLPFR